MAFADGFKQKVHERFLQSARDRVDAFTDMIRELSADAQNDAKSSAGDKHDPSLKGELAKQTALSMMHLEQEKLNAKLAECLEQLRILERIDPEQVHDRVHVGSLVRVNAMNLYIACALPKISVDGVDVIGVSAEAPIALSLRGLGVGEEVVVNGATFTVKEIL